MRRSHPHHGQEVEEKQKEEEAPTEVSEDVVEQVMASLESKRKEF